MALAHVGSIGTAQGKSSSSSIVITTTADAFAGDVVVVMAAFDNNNAATTTGPDSDAFTVTDSVGGNTWDFIAGGEDADTDDRVAATIELSVLSNDLPSGSTITLTYVSSRPARSALAERFTMDEPEIRLYRRVWVPDRAVDPSALQLDFPALADREVLLLHALGGEGPDTDAYTWDSDYTEFTGTGTTGGTDVSNMHIRGGFRIATGLSSDSVDVQSDTANRDYTQLYAVLAPVRDDIAPVTATDEEGFVYDSLLGWVYGQGASSTWTVRLDGPIPIGAMLVAVGSCTSNNASTVTGPNDETLNIADSAGNTWVKQAGAQDAGTNSKNEMHLFTCLVTNPIPANGTVTFTHTVSSRTLRNGTVWLFWPAQRYVERVERLHLHTRADPGEIANTPGVAMAQRTGNPSPVLVFHALAARTTDQTTFDYSGAPGFTELDGMGSNSNTQADARHVCAYRIMDDFEDSTVDVGGTSSDNTQLLLTLATRIVHGTVKIR